MEVRIIELINEKGLFSTKKYQANDIVFVLSGKEYDHPTRETIYIGDGKHIDDKFGQYINHSFTPNVWINNRNVIALVDIMIDDEITFNYNDNEIDMAQPFIVSNILVCGKKSK